MLGVKDILPSTDNYELLCNSTNIRNLLMHSIGLDRDSVKKYSVAPDMGRNGELQELLLCDILA